MLIHTGRWQRAKAEGEWNIEKGSAGLHASCLPWLKARDVAIVGSDLLLDVLPCRSKGVGFPVHMGALVAMGMPILDVPDLDAAVSRRSRRVRKRWMFALTVALPSAVQGEPAPPGESDRNILVEPRSGAVLPLSKGVGRGSRAAVMQPRNGKAASAKVGIVTTSGK